MYLYHSFLLLTLYNSFPWFSLTWIVNHVSWNGVEICRLVLSSRCRAAQYCILSVTSLLIGHTMRYKTPLLSHNLAGLALRLRGLTGLLFVLNFLPRWQNTTWWNKRWTMLTFLCYIFLGPLILIGLLATCNIKMLHQILWSNCKRLRIANIKPLNLVVNSLWSVSMNLYWNDLKTC